MKIKMNEIWFTQKVLKRIWQIPDIVKAIENEDIIEPIKLQICEDDQIEILNGHHRITAMWLAGLKEITNFKIFIANKTRNRFFKVGSKKFEDLLKQNTLCMLNT